VEEIAELQSPETRARIEQQNEFVLMLLAMDECGDVTIEYETDEPAHHAPEEAARIAAQNAAILLDEWT
jgi:hypothetical protein